MFSSDDLAFWLSYAEVVRAPERIPLTGSASKEVRCVVVRFSLDGFDYLFEGLDGTSVAARLWENDRYRRVVHLSIFDVWRSVPWITQYWNGSQIELRSWAGFAHEQTWRLRSTARRVADLFRSVQGAASRFRKPVSVERFLVLSAVMKLQPIHGAVSDSEVARHLLGSSWMMRPDAADQLDSIGVMLKALAELNEVKYTNYRYMITGKGIDALSKYEEEERKHRESIRLQSGIRWLTVVMAIAALLQAQVIKIPSLWSVQRWPWQ